MKSNAPQVYAANELLYTEYLKTNTAGIKLPAPMAMEKLLEEIKKNLAESNIETKETLNLEQSSLVFYQTKAKILGKIGLKYKHVILISKTGDKIYFTVKSGIWLMNQKEQSKKIFNLKDSHIHEVETAIYQAIIHFYKENNNLCDKNNLWLKEFPTRLELSLYQQLKEKEIILAYARAEDMQQGEEKEKYNAFFVLTNERQFLFSENFQMIQFSQHLPLEEKFEIGRNRIIWANSSFLASKMHKKNMEIISHCPPNKEQSGRYVLAQQKDTSPYPRVLHEQIIAISNNPFDIIALYLRDKSFKLSDELIQEQIEEKMEEILYNEQWRSQFRQYTQEWQLSHEEQLFIVQLFLDMTDDSSTFDDLFEIHSEIRKEYHQKNKDLYARLFFDTGYCKHLIRMQKTKEAAEIISENISQIPDESIWDLLPTENRQLQEQNGQILRISYMEMLLKIKENKEKNQTAMQLLMLQPFNLALAAQNGEFSHKAQKISQLLQGHVPENLPLYSPVHAILDEKLQKKIEHPLSSKNKLITQIQTWLAEHKETPVDVIKKYGEPFDTQKYPLQQAILENLKSFFDIPKLDVFVVYGEKAAEITAFEDKIPFLTIGHTFLLPDSELLYSDLEFTFAMAAELSNLYIKSTFITSSDVWKGAAKKGLYLADTLLSIIPAVGILTQSLQHIQKLDKLVGLIQRIEKLKHLGKSGLDIIQQLQKLKLYKPNEAEPITEILLSSRLLRINADRMGLLACGSISHSLSAILKQHQNYSDMKSNINNSSLLVFLNEKDKKGDWKHIELAIRIAALFSFFLSEEYEQLFKELHQNPENAALVFFK